MNSKNGFFNEAKDTISRFKNPDKNIVFVNAWNE